MSVGIAVTSTDKSSGAGDLFTALGLGDALVGDLGWDVRYLPPDLWRDARGLDVYICMRDDTDPRTLERAQPHLVRVAWMRNWLERWVDRPWLDQFDLLLVSSTKGQEFLHQAGVNASLFPIAADHRLFSVGPIVDSLASDYVFTGNYWKASVQREIELLDPAKSSLSFAVYGKNWGEHPRFSPYHRGFVDFTDLPAIYNSTKLVIDDTVTHVTKLWGSVNSRVFEAIAAGALVITNNEIGSREIFQGRLPVWESAARIEELVDFYLRNSDERQRLSDELRAEVLEKHTYSVRAKRLKELLTDVSLKMRVSIKCPVPSYSEAPAWGDFHFAQSLARALRDQGFGVRVDLLPEWYSDRSCGDDVVIVLRGLSEYSIDPSQINIAWLISHPELVSVDELSQYDHVFVASESHSKTLAAQCECPVGVLLQCSDPSVFRIPEACPPDSIEDILFVGNTRGQQRTAVSFALAAGLPLSVFGRGWANEIPPENFAGELVANSRLHLLYGAAKIVLNDHWPDMAAKGFISNRIFDVALSGGVVVSDDCVGLREIFGDLVPEFSDSASLRSICLRLLDDPARRLDISTRLRSLVLDAHTFSHRAVVIAATIQTLSAKRKLSLPKSKLACESSLKSRSG